MVHRRFLCSLLVLLWALLPCHALAQATHAAFSLRWEIASHQYREPDAGGTTVAILRLQNRGPALPAAGWSLYFNCPSELHLGALPGHLVAEHLGGTLFRIRPQPSFPGLPSGQTLDIEIEHPEVVVKESRAPIGPYLVFDAAPDSAVAITDYTVAAPQRNDQEPRGVDGHAYRETAADRYAANTHIQDISLAQLPPVLPTPRTFRRTGEDIRFASRPIVTAEAALAPEKALIDALFEHRLQTTSIGRVNTVSLSIDPQLPANSPEAYRLNASVVHGVQIVGRSAAGVARGVASLQQLVRVTDQGVSMPSVVIEDEPRFAYRGLHVDVARNFQPKEVVFRLIDLMARHKLNTLHFHLTDDEGWRLEILGLPELTQVGARRGHHTDPLAMLPPAHGSGPDPSDPHGSGYYTADDYVAILRHAAQRRIEVIPEIEMPGHARAAVKAMEARYRHLQADDPQAANAYRLADPEDQSHYVSAQGFSDNVINPAPEGPYRFADQVIATVAALHRKAGTPLEMIHLGGDELPRGAWTDSPAVQRWMAQDHLADRQAVWDRFYARMADIAARHGLRVAGWEEIGARRASASGALEPNPVLLKYGFQAYVWNDLEGAEDLGFKLANAGYPTVLAPVTAYYFDMVHNRNPEEPGATWAPPLDLYTAFDFDPIDYARHLPGDAAHRVQLSHEGAAHIVGLEGTLWSETMRDPQRIEYLLLPRMLGLAERAWAPTPVVNTRDSRPGDRAAQAWSVFMNQVARIALPALDADGAANYRIPAPGLQLVGQRVLANHEYPGFTLRYTLDGLDPNADSTPVDGPIPLTPGLRVAAFSDSGRRGWIATPLP